MSVEKVPNVGANGASTKTKSDGAVKGGYGPTSAGDSGGQAAGFGALLYSLGADDADIGVDRDVVALQAQDPLQTDPNAGGNLAATFIPTIQVALPIVAPLFAVDSDVVALQAQDPLQTDPNAGGNLVATFIPTIQVALPIVVPLFAVDRDVVALQAQDPLQTDPNAGGNLAATFIPTIQVALPIVAPLNVDVLGNDAVLNGNALLTEHDTQTLASRAGVADSVEGDPHAMSVNLGAVGMQNRMAAMNKDELTNEIVPAVPKFGFADVVANTSTVLQPGGVSRRQFGVAEAPDALSLSSATAKLAKSLKERGRAETAASAVAASTPNAAVVVSAKAEVRGVADRADVVGRAAAVPATQVISQEPVQQMEFRREKAVFKTNSTTTSTDVSVASGADSRPNNLSLEGMTADTGAGLSQGEEGPGTYWMSSDLKNAEMKLDGFGESAVEVSISVHGNQAHVAFRSDEEQTRLALGDAGATLKDMLHKEGLDLAGVSVGTSNAGGEGGQERRSRQENRPGFIEKLANNFPSGTSGKIVSNRVGQLDVFV